MPDTTQLPDLRSRYALARPGHAAEQELKRAFRDPSFYNGTSEQVMERGRAPSAVHPFYRRRQLPPSVWQGCARKTPIGWLAESMVTICASHPLITEHFTSIGPYPQEP
jgi:hypothetical protein